MKKTVIIVTIVNLLVAAGLLYYFVFMKKLDNSIVIPYISHQKPRIDPHVPGFEPTSDKLDEVIFNGLFDVSANASGITYEDGLGELLDISKKNVVTIRLKPSIKWHRSYSTSMEKEKITVSERKPVNFVAKDLRFTLKRIQKLGSLSPDYILVSQAMDRFDFEGPDENGEIKFSFNNDRVWNENDVKEVLSFKIIPADSPLNASNYREGTGPYMYVGEYEDNIHFINNPSAEASIQNFIMRPYIDNSTYTTELKNNNINTLLETPFGAISPILADTNKFFYKSSIATTFFALMFNTQKLNLEQRKALRALVDNKRIMNRFFKLGTEQQRHVANYKGSSDNYDEYLNNSVFPTTSYYIDEKIVTPFTEPQEVDMSVLPDTVRVQTCLNYGLREELTSLVEIFNDPAMFHGKIKVSAVSNAEIAKCNYDAILIPITGYRSNFLFDLYNIFLKYPDFEVQKINLRTTVSRRGDKTIDKSSFSTGTNFCNIDFTVNLENPEDFAQFADYVYGFMSTHEIGDKQAYAQYIDELEHNLALGKWLFSLPSLAYFRTQFDKSSIDLYGVASQLSTIEKWKEKTK